MTGGPLGMQEDVELQPDVWGQRSNTFETKQHQGICIKGRLFEGLQMALRLRSEIVSGWGLGGRAMYYFAESPLKDRILGCLCVLNFN